VRENKEIKEEEMLQMEGLIYRRSLKLSSRCLSLVVAVVVVVLLSMSWRLEV